MEEFLIDKKEFYSLYEKYFAGYLFHRDHPELESQVIIKFVKLSYEKDILKLLNFNNIKYSKVEKA